MAILRVLREVEVRQRTGLSHTSIHLMRKAGTFPHPISLGGRAVGWLEHEIEDWIAGRVAAREASV